MSFFCNHSDLRSLRRLRSSKDHEKFNNYISVGLAINTTVHDVSSKVHIQEKQYASQQNMGNFYNAVENNARKEPAVENNKLN